ncbi:hypothetical protein ACH5RR_025076 [Cinchona calisaya]|uniref:Peptidase S49 domain-containing protein n=1 Tax=Cinchona calisaya TaxID=153742 RepID=A0ABD2YZN2_9GENT
MFYRIWREIRLLAKSKPVVASMADAAASGGYYMAMGVEAIVAENLTLTGSIGVVAKAEFVIGYCTEGTHVIGRPDKAELFAKSAQNLYREIWDKASLSRSMPWQVDKMEEFAQGRGWTGNDAASRRIIDAIGGLSRAVAIAKQKANIPQDQEVTLVELVRPSPSLPEIVSRLGKSLVGADTTLKQLLDDLAFSDEIQARMDGIIMFQNLDGADYSSPILLMMKDYVGSL